MSSSSNSNNNHANVNASPNTDQNTTWGYSASAHEWIPSNRNQSAGPATLFTPGSQETNPFQYASMPPPPPPPVYPGTGHLVPGHPPFAPYGYNGWYDNVAPDVNFNPNFHAQPLEYIPAPGMHPAMFPAPWPPAPPPHWQNTFPVEPPFDYHVHTPASISNTYPPYVYIPNGGWDNVKLPPVYNMHQDAPLFPANNILPFPGPPAATANNTSHFGSSSSTASISPTTQTMRYSSLPSSSKMPSGTGATTPTPSRASPALSSSLSFSSASSASSSSSSPSSLPSSSPRFGWQPARWPESKQPSAASGSMDDIASFHGVNDRARGGEDHFNHDGQDQAASHALPQTTNSSTEAAREKSGSSGPPSSGLEQRRKPGSKASRLGQHSRNKKSKVVYCNRDPCNGKALNRASDLRRHLRSGIHNKDPDAVRYHCRVCLTGYARRDLVLRHLSCKDETGEEQTGCLRLKFRQGVKSPLWKAAEDMARKRALRFAEAGLGEGQKDLDVVETTAAIGAAAKLELDQWCPLPIELPVEVCASRRQDRWSL